MGFTDMIRAALQGAHAPDVPVSPGGPFQFDPEGPEKAGHAAKDAYYSHQWERSLELYVVAVDRLHDFYVYEGFRNRQPSIKDAWLIDGLVAALGVTREIDPQADVSEAVRTATHRLRTISTAIERNGEQPVIYRRALNELGRLAPDVDVSDIFWA